MQLLAWVCFVRFNCCVGIIAYGPSDLILLVYIMCICWVLLMSCIYWVSVVEKYGSGYWVSSVGLGLVWYCQLVLGIVYWL